MEITIKLPQDLEKELLQKANQDNISLHNLILQVLRQITTQKPKSETQWPEAILTYEGISEFPAFESYRQQLVTKTQTSSPQEKAKKSSYLSLATIKRSLILRSQV